MGTDVSAVSRGASDRRVVGAAILLLGVTLVLSVPALFGKGIAGTPRVIAFPPPPPVGSCADMAAGTPVVVDCAGRHDAEVMLSWPSWQAPPPSMFNIDGVPAEQQGQPLGFPEVRSDQLNPCWDAYLSYLPLVNKIHDDDSWVPLPPLLTVVLTQPPSTPSDNDRWFGCLVAQIDGATYTGSVKDLFPATKAWPAGVGSCWGADSDGGSSMIPCSTQHRIEQIGYWPSGDDVTTGAELTEGCAALAAVLLKTADPTYGGRLAIRVGDLYSEGNAPACFAELAGDGALTGSIVGLGDGPLPTG